MDWLLTMERPFPAYSGGEPYIFVSYAHEDTVMVYPEIQWLKDQGFNIWYDEGISPGAQWHQQLADQIQKCQLFLYFVTPNSAGSVHCQREVHYATDNNKAIITVYLQQAEMPGGLNLSLGSIQAILKYDETELDYRIKMLQGCSDHIQRGMSGTRFTREARRQGNPTVPQKPRTGKTPLPLMVMSWTRYFASSSRLPSTW